MILGDLLIYVQTSYARSLCLLDEATDTDSLIDALDATEQKYGDDFEFDFPSDGHIINEDAYEKIDLSLRHVMLADELEDYVISFPPYRAIVECGTSLDSAVTKETASVFHTKLDQFCHKWFALLSSELRLEGPLSRLWESPWRNPPENVQKGHG